jgi:hypothetical protein
MAARRVNRLYDLELDEVSHVDRPANQHGAVVIAKRAAEDQRMAMYDEEGYELDEDLLEPGDEAYDENGNQFVMVSDEEAAELVEQGVITLDDDMGEGSYYEPENAYAGVGKLSLGDISARATQAGGALKRNKRLAGAAAGTGAAAGFAARGGGGKQTKSASLGSDVFETLSKALHGNEARQAVSKLAEMVKESQDDAQAAWAVAKALADERDLEEYVELASTYPVAADPQELGTVLARVAKNQAGPNDLAYLDRVLSADPVNYEEVGYSGYAENSVMDQIAALAGQVVSKRGDVSLEEATVAFFDTNTDAYELYLEEQKG